jgi:hypothetical protein
VVGVFWISPIMPRADGEHRREVVLVVIGHPVQAGYRDHEPFAVDRVDRPCGIRPLDRVAIRHTALPCTQ